MICMKCGADFNQDDAIATNAGVHQKLHCPNCGTYAKFAQTAEDIDENYVVEFGKHAGKTIAEIERTAPGYIAFLANGRGKVARYCKKRLTGQI